MPDFSGVSLDNNYFTFKEGELYAHDSTTKNNFYGINNNSTVKVIFNDVPDKVKNFKSLSYDGDANWDAFITTKTQDGKVDEWKKKEDLYYNFIKGYSTQSTSDFSVQGIGKANANASSTDVTFDKPINVSVAVGDLLYRSGTNLATVTAISADRLTLTVGTSISYNTTDFLYVHKPMSTFVSSVVGTYAEVEMRIGDQGTAKNELFSIGAEAFISSE